MIHLSYSTINNCLQPENSHNWINRQLQLKPEVRPYWTEGKEAHKIIQSHVSGKKFNPRLSRITFRFPIVEEVDFDPHCKFSFKIKLLEKKPSEYEIIGFYDGLNEETKRFLEIKTSHAPWSIGKFQKSMQRKLYALARPDLKEAIFVTCPRIPNLWNRNNVKVYKVPCTQKDRDEANEWILDGIKVLESGSFKGGLTNGVCENPYCYFGCNCSFK